MRTTGEHSVGCKRRTVLVLVLIAVVVLSSPEAAVRVFGEWGYRHLVSDDKKVEMINGKLANPDFPLIMIPGSGWSAGVYYARELLYCKSANPPDFVLTGPCTIHEYEGLLPGQVRIRIVHLLFQAVLGEQTVT